MGRARAWPVYRVPRTVRGQQLRVGVWNSYVGTRRGILGSSLLLDWEPIEKKID